MVKALMLLVMAVGLSNEGYQRIGGKDGVDVYRRSGTRSISRPRA